MPSKECNLGEMSDCVHCTSLGDVVRAVLYSGVTGREHLWIKLGDICLDKCVDPSIHPRNYWAKLHNY